MFASVNGMRLFFDVVGEKLHVDGAALKERPTLICLHGGPGGDHQSLRPDFDRFAQRAQVLYFDQRGGGRSGHGPPELWTLDQWADDVAGLCGALGVEKPIVIGVSGGAMVALSYLERYPGEARGAILVNACARLDRDALIEGFRARGGPEAGAAAQAMFTRCEAADFAPFIRHCVPLYSRRAPVLAPEGAARSTFNFAVNQAFFGPGGEAFRFDFRARLGAVTCPVLALSGAHDPITMAQWGREVVEALPPGVGAHVVFENSSHAISTDEPGRFFAAVEDFIDSLARAV